MADNTTLPVPSTSGDVIATDDISGVKYQRVKMTIGADGVNDGDVSSANPLPVEIQGALGTADTRSLGSSLVSGDIGIVSNTVIHGLTTGGGGGYVDVKVNPSGSLAVDASGSTVSVTNFPATQPISAASLPLPTGAATEASVSIVASAIDAGAMEVKAKRADLFKWSFAKVVSNGIDTEFGTLLKTGSGMTVNQTGGNLVVTTGTTAYSETVIRSSSYFSGSGVCRYAMQLSQRIANQNFAVEFVDVIGDALAMTINSATSVTVTKVAHGFTSADVGNGIWIGMCSVANCLTQRAVIASIPTVDTITLTVAGFPASGSGTCSLFGYNFHQVIYSGATATSLGNGYSTQRKGWANAATNATINTTASPGHIGIMETIRCIDAAYLDQVPGTGTSVQPATRATVNQNVPDPDTQLYLQVRVFNGSTAPASTTTMTMGFIDAQMYDPLMVNVSGVQSFSAKNTIPVVQQGTATVAVSGTVTVTNTPVTPTTTFTNSAATTNATSIKASAGTIWNVLVSNTNASPRYLKFYNKASAPTVGTDVPVIVIPIPATGSVKIDGGSNGIRFSTGIGMAITTGMADSDTGAVAANEIKVATSFT